MPPDRYSARQAALAAALTGASLPGAVVVSRGGGTFDRHGDVAWLTGHYQAYSYLPETPGLFSGRSHCAAVIEAGGRCLLCTSVAEIDEARVTADGLRCGPSFAGTIAGALRELGLDGPVGLIGGDVMSHALAADLAGRGVARWRACDESLAALRRIKDADEVAVIRRAAALHRDAQAALEAELRPGRTEAQAAAAFARVALEGGAGLYFTAMASGSRSLYWAGQPVPGFSTRRLEAGDLVRFDMGLVLDGYLSDFGRTRVVGPPDAAQERLLSALHTGLDAAIAAVGPGVAVRDVAAAGDAALADAAGIEAGFPAHWGHGLGLGWERPWMVADEPLSLEAGMYLAIERSVTLPGTGSAAAEQTLLVTGDGHELLSADPADPWRQG